MEQARHQRAQELFERAKAMPADARRAWLEGQCREDPSMVDEVMRLVSHHEAPTEFMRKAVGDEVMKLHDAPTKASRPISQRPSERAPASIGRYRIVETLGEGGMGVVYLAQRDDEGGGAGRVALKLMRSTVATPEERQRFERERRLLSALSHPHIARLLDIGTTDDGHPYFVMEYIEGRHIDRYCDENRLTTEERLSLFRKVCDAVHYVHQNLIIHRDIKPGNIMVTPQGEPKLLDFGISKLANPALEPEIEVTHRGFRLLTPRYASPEQIQGVPLSTSTDIYSLGVLLYELLTGHWPYRVKTTELREIEHAICDLEPERPSTAINRTEVLAPDGKTRPIDPRLVCQHRDGAPGRLRGKLRGDIDNVLLKALDKAPRKRYASAEQFSEDIRRHLVNETVIARPPSVKYRLAKFVRRNRSAVATGTLVMLSLAIGLAVSTSQWRRAEVSRIQAEQREREVRRARDDEAKARGVAQSMSDLATEFLSRVTVSHEGLLVLPGAVRAREEFGNAALEFVEKYDAATADSSVIQKDEILQRRRLAQVLNIAGRVKADPRSGNLGDVPAALRLQNKALDIRRAVLAQEPSSHLDQTLVADSLIRVGDLKRYSGACTDSVRDYDEAIAILGPIAEDPASRDDAQARLAGALAALGECRMWLDDLDGASIAYERAQEIRRIRHASAPTPESKRNLTVGFFDLGEVRLQRGDAAAAAEFFLQAVVLRRELHRAEPGQARTRLDLARALIRLSEAQRVGGDLPGARTSAIESEAILNRLLEEEGLSADVRHRLAWIWAQLCIVESDPAEPDRPEADDRLDRAAVEMRKLMDDAPDVIEHRRLNVRVLVLTGERLLAAGDQDARRTLEEARDAATALVALSATTRADLRLRERVDRALKEAAEGP